MKKEWLAHLGLIFESSLYAGSYIVAKFVVLEPIGPLELTLLRAIFAGVLFTLFHLLFVREKVAWRDLGLLAICSLMGITVSNICFFQGISLTSPLNGALITLSAPLFLIVFAIVAQGEIELKKLLGIFIAAIGGACLVFADGGSVDDAPNPILGNILIGCSAGAFAIYLTLIKPLLMRYKPITVLRWLFTFGMLYLLPFFGYDLINLPWSTFTFEAWGALFFILVCITFITFLLNTFAMRVLNPSVVSTYIYTTPLITAAIGVIAQNDKFSPFLIVAGVLILTGGYLVSSSSPKPDNTETENQDEETSDELPAESAQ